MTAAPAHAQSSTPSEQPLAHLQHTSWTLKDGMAGPVMAIAQTTDGYLWLGTGAGLFRFDGVRFERFDTIAGESLPSRQVLSLFATKDNALWVGLLDGGAALVREGRVLHVDAADGPFVTSTRAFAQQADGTLWAATGRALLKRDGVRWTAVGPESGYDDGTGRAPPTMKVDVDGRGNVWAVTDRAVFVKAAASARFVATGGPSLGLSQLAIAPDGRAWTNDMSPADRGVAPLPVPGESPASAAAPRYPVPRSFFMPAFDRRGLLWYGALDGINRMDVSGTPAAAAASRQFFGTDKGLSGELVMRIFQDRDGAIWVGTNGGLDRFRGAAVDRVDLASRNTSIAMSTDGRGQLWIASGNTLQHRAPGDTAIERLPVDPEMETFTSVHVDGGGRVLADSAGAGTRGNVAGGLGRGSANRPR